LEKEEEKKVEAPVGIKPAPVAEVPPKPKGVEPKVEGVPPAEKPAAGYAALFSNRSFVLNTLAMAAMTFALGGLAQWMPSFLHRIYALDVARSNTLFGAIFMSMLDNGMNVVGIDQYLQQAILGIMVIVGVTLTFDRTKTPIVK